MLDEKAEIAVGVMAVRLLKFHIYVDRSVRLGFGIRPTV
jgi:hypothetical protein